MSLRHIGLAMLTIPLCALADVKYEGIWFTCLSGAPESVPYSVVEVSRDGDHFTATREWGVSYAQSGSAIPSAGRLVFRGCPTYKGEVVASCDEGNPPEFLVLSEEQAREVATRVPLLKVERPIKTTTWQALAKQCQAIHAHSPSTSSHVSRPSVWWRAVPQRESHGFWIPARYEDAPYSSHEVYYWIPASSRFGEKRGSLLEFFSGKVIKFGGYEDVDRARRSETTYADGHARPLLRRVKPLHGPHFDLVSIEASRSAASGHLDDDDEALGKHVPKPRWPFRFLLSNISAIGPVLEEFRNLDGTFRGVGQSERPDRIWFTPSASRSAATDSGISCDPLYWAVQARDQDGKILWRRMFAAHGPLLTASMGPSGKSEADPYRDGCYRPGQYKMQSVSRVTVVLDDDTALMDLGFGVLRIRAREGRPDVMPSSVSVVEYADLMRLKQVLMDSVPTSVHSPTVRRSLSPATIAQATRQAQSLMAQDTAAEYFVLQYFVFPQLAPGLKR